VVRLLKKYDGESDDKGDRIKGWEKKELIRQDWGSWKAQKEDLFCKQSSQKGKANGGRTDRLMGTRKKEKSLGSEIKGK